MLTFRPLPTLTAYCTVLFAILIGLGVWQLGRLQQKLRRIAEVHQNLAAAPISLDDALALGPTAEYRRVALDGHLGNAKEAYVFGTDDAGAPVYHVMVPFQIQDGRTMLVDRGIVPKEKIEPNTRRASQIENETHVIGVWRTPDPPGWFTPTPDLTHRIWYAHDLTAIAKADGITLAAPVVVEADATPNRGGWPRGGQTRVTFRNEHLQYAITWFGLAAVLLGVYIAFHISRGRLGWKR